MKRVLTMVLLAVGVTAAQAQPIDPLGNTRPTVVNPAPAGERSLSEILNGGGMSGPLFPGFVFDVIADQQRAGVWRSATPSVGTTVPTLVIEYAGFANINKFGIWFGTDASRIVAYDLLLGPATAGSFAAVLIGHGRLDVIGFGCGVAVNCSGSSGWLDARINPNFFGFYFQTGTGPRVYSLDALNVDREARFLSYRAGATNDWVFAYEDIAFRAGSDRDYNDMVVKVESIVAVPEPSTYAMLIAGLALMGWVSLRRRQK